MAVPQHQQEGDVSPNIHFRELDDEFMQKQAKVWLEAVLGERYGETQSLADLLADGDILFRVSKLLKEMIRTSSGGDAAFPRLPFSEVAHDGKGGRYLPYSNVDAFLKICKRVGLPDVDLFTPPDVVEKKDIRRVCFCIRALSKKARSQNLPVPDFDKVAHSVPMPTDKVGGIREHLQHAASMSSSSDYKSPRPQSIGKVLSSPNLVGSSFLDTPPSISSKQGSQLPSSGESLSGKFEETTSPQVEDDEATDDGDGNPGTPELEDNEEREEDQAAVEEEEIVDDYPEPKDNREDQAEVEEEETADDYPEPKDNRELNNSEVEEPKENRELNNSEVEVEEIAYQQQQEQQNTQDHKKNGGGLVIPFAVGVAAFLASILAMVALRPSKQQQQRENYYVVKEGDTLSKISRSYGRTGRWKELVEMNPGLASNPDLIYPTDRLKLT